MKHILLSLGLLLFALAGQAQVSNTFYGSLTAADPTIPGGRLNRDGVTASCGVTKTYPGVVATATGVHYDTYTITNPSTTTSACATLTLTPACSEGTGLIFCSVYLTTFNSAALATNYRSDMGVSPGTAPISMGVTLAAREVLVLVISGVASTSTCSSYGLGVSAPVALGVQSGHDAQPTLAAYPNPVEDVLHITSTKAGRYTLYSTTGEKVMQITGSAASLRDLPGGVYILQQDDTKAATHIVKL